MRAPSLQSSGPGVPVGAEGRAARTHYCYPTAPRGNHGRAALPKLALLWIGSWEHGHLSSPVTRLGSPEPPSVVLWKRENI